MLIQLAAMILARRQAQALAEVSGLAGVAMGIAGLLRIVALHRARGQCYVPKEMLEHHGVIAGPFACRARRRKPS